MVIIVKLMSLGYVWNIGLDIMGNIMGISYSTDWILIKPIWRFEIHRVTPRSSKSFDHSFVLKQLWFLEMTLLRNNHLWHVLPCYIKKTGNSKLPQLVDVAHQRPGMEPSILLPSGSITGWWFQLL